MLNILIGLLILSFMVCVHEFGHFLAAKACGVVVESFSIGWGPILLRKKKGDTEYRLSAIPMGGYCGMKGEKAFQQALQENLPAIPKDEGSLYSASAFKRILIAVAGPFANFLTAVIALAIVSAIGSTHFTSSNKIAPVYYYTEADDSPAKIADLKMGDKIVSINGQKTETFSDIIKIIVPAAQEELDFQIERDGKILNKKITPKLNPKTGAGQVGFYSFVPLELAGVQESSAAAMAGLKAGDKIITANGKSVENTRDLEELLKTIEGDSIELGILRGSEELKKQVSLIRTESGFDLGIQLKFIKVEVSGTGFFESIVQGFVKTHETLVLTFKSLALLFKGVDLKEAVSGPLRITHMLGDVASQGFSVSFWSGLSDILNFISLISISLFIMNLLPIPVLDGGMIFFAFIELIIRKPVHPKVLYYIQFIGFAFIAIVFIFALWGDIRFFLFR